MLPRQVPIAGFDFPGPQHPEKMNVVVSSAATTRMCVQMMMVILLPPPLDEITNHLDAAMKSPRWDFSCDYECIGGAVLNDDVEHGRLPKDAYLLRARAVWTAVIVAILSSVLAGFVPLQGKQRCGGLKEESCKIRWVWKVDFNLILTILVL